MPEETPADRALKQVEIIKSKIEADPNSYCNQPRTPERLATEAWFGKPVASAHEVWEKLLLLKLCLVVSAASVVCADLHWMRMSSLLTTVLVVTMLGLCIGTGQYRRPRKGREF